MKCFTQLILIKVCLLIAITSMAQNFTVNSTADVVDNNIGDGVCADVFGNCTLRAAIQESNAMGGAHTITLSAAIYTLNIAGANENVGASGDLDITCTLTINGMSAQTTIIDAGGLDRAIHIAIGATLIGSEFSITGGILDRGFGGGILNEGTLTYTSGELYSNSATLVNGTITEFGGFGGGIANLGTTNLTKITIRANTAIGSEGPGAVDGGGGGGSTPGFGGGIYNENGAILTITNSTISGNQAMGGRGSRGSSNNGVWDPPGSSGGGLLPGGGGAGGGGAGGNATGDYSGGGGGGGRSAGGGSGGNGGYGAGGGAVGAKTSGGSSANPVGISGFGGGSGNNACCSSAGGGGAGAGFGGGIFNNGGDVTTTNVTIAFNEALGGNGRTALGGWAGRGLIGSGLGGGIFNRSGTVNINNTLLANNNISYLTGAYIAIDTTYEDTWGTFTSTIGYNLIYNGGTAVIGGTTTGNVIGADPILTALAMNGGSALTHAISDCNTPSPAIDAGLDAAAPAIDQRGFARFNVLSGANISDIGAFESDCTILPIELISFNAKCNDGYLQLNWATASEINNDYFTIEKSVDAINFEEIATVNGNGNSETTTNYLWSDNNSNSSESYYRLKQTDFNGNSKYHGTRTINCENLYDVNIYPNPFKNNLIIQLSETITYPTKIEIVDYLGRKVYTHIVEGQSIAITLNEIPSGTYFIKVVNETTQKVKRILKMK